MNPTNSNPLATLKDIHLPPDPGWWPPAVGWWFVIIVLLVLVGYAIFWWRQRWLFRRPIKLALGELAQLDLESKDPPMQRQTVQQLSALLRRFCLAFFPRREVAALCGQQWLDFLKERAGEKGLKINDADLRPLLTETYAPAVTADLKALAKTIEKWLLAQKRKTRRKP